MVGRALAVGLRAWRPSASAVLQCQQGQPAGVHESVRWNVVWRALWVLWWWGGSAAGQVR